MSKKKKVIPQKQTYEQLVLVEFNNSAPGLWLFQSNKKITIDMVADYLMEHEDFNEEKDSATFIDFPTEKIKL